MRRKVLDIFTANGVLVTDTAGQRILESEEPLAEAEKVLAAIPEDVVFISLEMVEKILGPLEAAPSERSMPTPIYEDASDENLEEESGEELPLSSREEIAGKEEKNTEEELIDISGLPDIDPRLFSREIPSRIEMLVGDISGSSSGDVGGFQRYFKDRLFSLRELVKRRRGYASASKISYIDNGSPEIKIIGMVKEASRSKMGDIFIEVEDETGTLKAIIPRDSPSAGLRLLNDEVIGLTCKRTGGRGGFRVEELVFPEIPVSRTANTSDHPVVALFCSDVHVGSSTFLGGPWRRFLDSLRTGEGFGDWSELVKYIVIPGDVVDGIGIFPNQQEELIIDDIGRQYDELARIIAPIPDQIEVIMMPGNHDAVRPAEPQPAFPNYIQEKFSDQGANARFLSNPSAFSLDGVDVLAYHGKSMDDIVSSIPGMSYEQPLEAMKLMLQKRHLAPIYGGKTPLAPGDSDHMVINRIPDIFVTGHVHSAGAAIHRGVLMVNASTWQSQTMFQKMHNFNPIPAKIPAVNLHSLELRMYDYMGGNCSRVL